MSDMIDRNAAIAALEDRRNNYLPDSQTWLQIQMDLLAIRALPAVEVGVRDNDLREAIDRAWCHEENVAKEWDIDLAEAVLYEVRSALTVAPARDLCEDEGCPHHGIPHICINNKPTPAPDAGKVQALVEALEKINVGKGWAAKIARAALAAMKEGGGMMTAEEWNDKPTGSNDGRCHQMTDPELDALVKRLENVSLQVGFPSRTILDSAVIRQAIDTITTLRAQLAEAMAGLHGPINQLSASDYSNIIAHLSLELEPTGPLPSRNTVMMALVKESNASRQQAERAIHAEAERDAAQAALAAQIEAAAGIAEAQEALAAKRANDDDADARSDWDDGLIFGTQVGARLISAAIRAQLHDRTALDRMLRAEREKSLREAAGIAAHYTDKITAEDIANSILAMVKREGGE